MSLPKVAVITRTKDRSYFLNRAIKSVASQTFGDYIHVILNDGGDADEVKKIIDSQPESVSKKIKLYNRAVSSNAPDTIFNEAIDKVDSEYVVIHDDDDSWHKDFLLLTTQLLDENKTFGGIVARADKIIEKITKNGLKLVKKEAYMPSMSTVSLYLQFIDNQLTPIAFLFRRSAYEKVGKFDSSLPVVGDWEFGIRFLQKYDVEFLDPGFALANYHHRLSGKDNSFARHNHRKYVTQVANKYLRQDLEKGVLGVGYIISDLKYRQYSRNEFVKTFTSKAISKIIKRRS